MEIIFIFVLICGFAILVYWYSQDKKDIPAPPVPPKPVEVERKEPPEEPREEPQQEPQRELQVADYTSIYEYRGSKAAKRCPYCDGENDLSVKVCCICGGNTDI